MPSCANRPRHAAPARRRSQRQADALTGYAPTLASALRRQRRRLEPAIGDDRQQRSAARLGGRTFSPRRLRPRAALTPPASSTFKPFVYGAALAAGMDPQREFDTRGVSLRLPDGTLWKPRDMGATPDGRSTLRRRPGLPRNSVTAQLIGEVGADKLARWRSAWACAKARSRPCPRSRSAPAR